MRDFDIEEARDIRDCQIKEAFLDAMEIPRGSDCRECRWMRESVIDQYEVDDDLCLPEDAFEVARKMCEECKKHTPEDRDNAIREFFRKEGLE